MHLPWRDDDFAVIFCALPAAGSTSNPAAAMFNPATSSRVRASDNVEAFQRNRARAFFFSRSLGSSLANG
jgi:hypothetical protein